MAILFSSLNSHVLSLFKIPCTAGTPCDPCRFLQVSYSHNNFLGLRLLYSWIFCDNGWVTLLHAFQLTVLGILTPWLIEQYHLWRERFQTKSRQWDPKPSPWSSACWRLCLLPNKLNICSNLKVYFEKNVCIRSPYLGNSERCLIFWGNIISTKLSLLERGYLLIIYLYGYLGWFEVSSSISVHLMFETLS